MDANESQQKHKQQLTEQQIYKYMGFALEQARLAAQNNQVPVGCVFMDQDHKIVARSHNLTNLYKNASKHCEINCITYLSSLQQQKQMQNLILFVTVEPCIMCAYALNLIGIKKVYFGQFNDRFGGCGSVLDCGKNKEGAFSWRGGIRSQESLSILKGFYQRGNLKLPEAIRNRARKRVQVSNQLQQQQN